MRKILIAAVAVVAMLATMNGCSKSNSSFTCNYDACAGAAPTAEVTQLETYLSGAGITNATKHCSGMYYTVTAEGTGAAPTACSYVSVNYKGTLTNGTVFDQTTTSPAVFNLVLLIEGWKKGIPLAKKGGKIRLYIPPSLGYGPNDQKNAAGVVVVPGNSILIFDIELLDVQ